MVQAASIDEAMLPSDAPWPSQNLFLFSINLLALYSCLIRKNPVHG